MQAVEHFITQFVPEHYDLFLDLSRETKTFSGKVTTTGQAKTDRISLHQKDLEIASVEVGVKLVHLQLIMKMKPFISNWLRLVKLKWSSLFQEKITDNMTGIYLLTTQLMEEEGSLVYSVRKPFCA